LPEPVDLEHAPVPTNDSERLLFRQLYRNLVRVDCAGEVHPELARAWTFDSAGRIWTFTLRDTSPSGERLSASQVLAAWRSRPTTLRALGIDSVIATGDRALAIAVRQYDSGPEVFADPALAVVSRAVSPGANGNFLEPTPFGPAVLDFVTITGDIRDAIDSGIDLVVTRDVDLAEYALRNRNLQIIPLPWSRTYVLIQPAGSPSLLSDSDSLRLALARDAVKAEARPAEPRPCGDAAEQVARSALSHRILYADYDQVARGLAERLVALNPGQPDLRAQGLNEALLAAAVHSGADAGYIVALSPAPAGPCSNLPLPPSARVQGLIQTRARAIVRQGSPELTVDWDGTPRLAP
jgi:hypothetical protein